MMKREPDDDDDDDSDDDDDDDDDGDDDNDNEEEEENEFVAATVRSMIRRSFRNVSPNDTISLLYYLLVHIEFNIVALSFISHK